MVNLLAYRKTSIIKNPMEFQKKDQYIHLDKRTKMIHLA